MSKPSPLDLKLLSCKEKLINLTRQNNLLFYKKRKKSSLVVKANDIQSFYNDLLDEERFRFWEIPKKEEEKEIEQDKLFPEKTEEQPEAEVDWLSVSPPEDDQIVCEFSTNDELHKILKNLFRRAKTEFDEKGLNIAYVFFGLMEWSEKQTSERIKSPIVLVPIKIEHKSARESYTICLGDEEVVLNPALKVKFKRDFNIALPELEGISEEWSLIKYFSALEEQLASLKVKVSPEVHIGLFSFQKLIMYIDYEKHHDLMKEHFLISCFGGEGKVDGINEFGGDGDEKLDDIKDVKRQFHILDADSSQQRCIEAACNGASFVMVGPPGTGKSQTIANIVAEFIEDGKSVLFVSEKMAALEVVFKRLKECDLSDFCLELHSHKANKKQVIAELGKSLAERVIPSETVSEVDYKQFLRLRDRLNNYLLALHERRQPLGLSVYEVLGQLSSLELMPYIPTGLTKDYMNNEVIKENDKVILSCPECSQKLRLPDVSKKSLLVTCPKCKKEFPYEKYHGIRVQGITQESLLEFDTLFDSLEGLWDVFIKGNSFSWYGFKSLNYTPALRYELQDLLERVLNRAVALTSRVSDFQINLGTLPVFSFLDFIRIKDAIEHLTEDVYVPSNWIKSFDYQKISQSVTKSKESKERYCLARDYLNHIYNEGFYTLDDKYIKGLISAFRDLQTKLGVQDYQVAELIRDLPMLRDSLRLFEETLRSVSSNQEIVWQDLEISAIKSLRNVEFVCKAINILFDNEKRPESAWFNNAIYADLDSRLQSIEPQVESIKNAERELLIKYKPEILTLDVDRLLELFKKNGFYRTLILKYFSPVYHKDSKRILEHSLKSKKINPKDIYDDLSKIKRLAELRSSAKEQEGTDRKLFGRFYEGEKTKFNDVREALEGLYAVQLLMKKLGLADSPAQIEMLRDNELWQRCSSMAEEISKQDKKVFEFLLKKGIPIADIKSLTIPDVLSKISQIITSSISLLAVLPSFQSCLISKSNFPSIQEIEESLKSLWEWRSVREEIARNSEEFTLEFGEFYNGVNTDWLKIEKAAAWYQDFLSMHFTLPADGKLKDLLVKPNSRKIDKRVIADFDALIVGLSDDLAALADQFNELVLNDKNIFLNDDEFILVLEKVRQLKDSIDEIKLWTDWQRLNYSLGRAGLEKFLSEIFVSRDRIFSEQVKSIFRKAIYSEWLNAVYVDDLILKDFRGEDHTKARDKFIELDIKLTRLSRSLVIQSGNERKPIMLNGSAMGSQVGLLRREMAKQKRHKPIKKLFSEIFDLVKKLKKCFLMSPMSVCQFLEPGKFKFDLIIFDEASQICVEDAFPAILRGNQVIIVGDNKQLPPTSFFKSEEQYEFDNDEDAPDIENLESILDECRGLGLRESLLKWHYRSRHEDLITYSNCKFYGRQLVTFPGAEVDVEHLGIKFEYVENAIYDRGGRRDNLAEAKRVAELVFDHFKNYPNKSLGVATLSIAQMEAVWDAIDLKLKENPEYEKFFIEDRLEGFFLRNLENLQGHERDVIIFSVGYGKDATGRLSMNFGPLNKNGGERRLNVLITRAREKNIVVTSIRASDFFPNITAEGVLHLRNYLIFAEKGINFLEAGLLGNLEDFESPLEESIAAAIRQMGYEVVCQVGCAGYRIDLGIVDPMNPKRYIIGIECDGATYHSSHSARDRDHLRQSVLENMGWCIYRIWSPDWVHQRSIEVAKLKDAIEAARFEREASSRSRRYINEPLELKVVQNSQGSDESIAIGIEYVVSDLGRRYKSKDFYSTGGQAIRTLLKKVIMDEAPIHIDLLFRRVMACYQLEKMGDRIYSRLMELLKEVVRDSSIRVKGNFVYTRDPIRARRPISGNEETLRDIEYISPEEIQDVMTKIIQLHSGVTADFLFGETLKFFGFQRQTESVVKFLKQSVKRLMKEEKLQSKDDFLIVVEVN